MGRFSDVERGPELAAEYEKLQLWRKMSKVEKKAAYATNKKTDTNRVVTERVPAYVIPFSASRPNIFYETFVPAATQTGQGGSLATLLRALANLRFATTAPADATDTIIEMSKFKFAQIRASTNSTQATKTTAVSRFTGRPYKLVYKDAMTINFGQLAAGDDFYAAVKLMKAKTEYTAFTAVKGNSISFRPEGA